MSRCDETLVVQSFRQTDVPAWISLCMQTVRDWASLHHMSYRFVGDELFGLLPEWVRQKAAHEITVLSDLAKIDWS